MVNNRNFIIRTAIFLCATVVYCSGVTLAKTPNAKDNRDNCEDKQPEILFRTGEDRSTAAISSISGDQAAKSPTSNLTNTFYGLLPGVAVMQGSGQLGYDLAKIYIRGRGTFNSDDSYVVFVDGFEVDISFVEHMLPSEVDKVFVLKDAASLSTMGMKGANGVLWIETRRGHNGRLIVEYNLRTGWQKPQALSKPLGSAQYAMLYNEAVSNDNGNIWTPYYSQEQINRYQLGQGIDVDWYDEVLKSSSPFTSTDASISGGGKAVRFFTTIGYVNSNGFYNVKKDDTRSNTRFDQYMIRTNLDFNVFKIFDGKVDIGARMSDNIRPNYLDEQLWYNLATYPNNIYNVYDGVVDNNHWSGTSTHLDNPAASIRGLGHYTNRDRTFQANFSLRERLDFITPGLYLQESGSFSTWTRGTYTVSRNYSRMLGGVAQTTDANSDYEPSDDRGTNQWTYNQFRVQAGYERTFGRNALMAAVNYEHYRRFVDANMNGNAGVQTTYAHQAINGRVNYAFDSRYIVEAGFSHCGSDNYSKENRFQFYPSVSAGWMISNESFMKRSPVVDLLKLRLSLGSTGYDYSSSGRYLYYQYYVRGNDFPTGTTSVSWNQSLIPAYIADADLVAEKSVKYNLGIDARLFDALQFTFDAFMDKRYDIVTQDHTYPAGYGIPPSYHNVGKVTTRGMEISLLYSNNFGDVNFSVGGMLTHIKDKVDYMAEVPTASPDAAATGNPLGSVFGYEFARFYDITDFDQNGSLKSALPIPTFGQVQQGDIKYTDRNGDMIIDERDMLKIGNGDFPNLYFSFNASVAYRGFDFSFIFQGAGQREVNLLDARSKTIAFVGNSTAYPIAMDRWAYYPSQDIDTRGSAKFPRLSTSDNTNNYKNSTLWIEKGNFLKLRNIELGYSLPKRIAEKIGMQRARIYINGLNLLTISSLKRKYGLDPERMTGYPAVKSFNIGLSVGF